MKKAPQTPIKTRNRYTAEDRANAVRYYTIGLNMQEISTLLGGCPIRTLEKWQRAEQWTKLRALSNIEIKAYELHKAGRSYKEIGQMLKISTVTVWRYISKVEPSEKA